MNANLETTIDYSKYAPIMSADVIEYREEDGEPMAETDFHINLIAYLRESLDAYFTDRADVYVSGCIMFYYIEGTPEEVISPDVMVCFGVPKGERRTYRVWAENNVVPSVVIEIASRKTFKKDRTEKLWLYEQLGIKEYFIYNPEYPKTIPSLLAYRLIDKEYQPLRVENGRVSSESLKLELVDTGKTLRLFNPSTNDFLMTYNELQRSRQTAEIRATNAEAELERLKVELAKLTEGK
jgi:Uma2 family endonuclease